MTIRAEVEGIGPVEFEDGTPESVIDATVKRLLAQSRAPQKSARSAIPHPVDMGLAVAQAPAKGLYGTLDTALDLFRGAGKLGARVVGNVTGASDKKMSDLITGNSWAKDIEEIAGANFLNLPKPEFYQPKTETARRVGNVAQAGSEGLMFGGMSGGAPGLLSGVGSEVAGMFSGDNPWMKALGGFLTPLGVGLAQAYRNAPAQMVKEAIGDTLTPQQVAQAKAAQESARQQGIPIMAAEALPDSGIQQLASNTLASRAGNQQMNQFFAQRPEQVKQAVQNKLIRPTSPPVTPDESMRAAREAATGVISRAEKARTQAVSPYYKAAADDPVDPQEIANLVKSIREQLKTAGSKPSQNAIEDIISQVTGAPKNAAAIDDVYKYLRESAEAGINATPAERAARGIYGPAAGELDTIARQSPNIAKGRDMYAQISRDVIDPLTSGPVGRVAGKHGVDPSLPESLAPLSSIANQQIARPESIKELYTQLNKQDPMAFQGMARTYLENAFDTASKRIQGGENRMSGANFANAIMGTPQQEKNFKEIMRGVAEAQGKKPDEVVRGVENLFEALRLTGKVPGIGSQTAPRLTGDAMAGRNMVSTVLESASPAAPLGGLRKRVEEVVMRQSYKELADAFTSPNGIDILVKMAKYNPRTTTGQYFAASLLGLTNEPAK